MEVGECDLKIGKNNVNLNLFPLVLCRGKFICDISFSVSAGHYTTFAFHEGEET